MAEQQEAYNVRPNQEHICARTLLSWNVSLSFPCLFLRGIFSRHQFSLLCHPSFSHFRYLLPSLQPHPSFAAMSKKPIPEEMLDNPCSEANQRDDCEPSNSTAWPSHTPLHEDNNSHNHTELRRASSVFFWAVTASRSHIVDRYKCSARPAKH